MSGHISKVEICSSCNNPVHVELCPGQLPPLVACGETYVAAQQQQAFNPFGGVGFSWVVEKSGVSTTILYTLPSNASADQVEQLVNVAKAGNGTDSVGSLRWSLGGALTPFPNTEWPSHGISYERASATTVRITWTPTNFAEDWSNTLVSLSSQQAWLTNTTSFTEEGLVNTWPLANLTATVWRKSLTGSVQALPVSVPCGVEVTNGDEIANAIAAGIQRADSFGVAETVWCVNNQSLIRVDSWSSGSLTTSWKRADGVAVVPTALQLATAVPGACNVALDYEVVERLVCAAGVTVVRQDVRVYDPIVNGVTSTVNWFGLNGVAVAAPASFTEGACDDQDVDLEVEYVCAAGVTLVRRRVVDGETGVLISEVFAGTNGAVVAAPAAYTVGQCVAPARDVETDYVCAAGVTLDRVRLFDTSTNPPTLLSTQFFGANGVAVAAPTVFTQGACGVAGPDNEFEVLCDVSTTPPTPYLRRAVVDSLGVVTWSNINISTGAAYVPVTPSVCDGYDVVESQACVLDTTTGGVQSARVVQVSRYGVLIGSPVVYQLGSNTVIVVAAPNILIDCDSVNVASTVWCRTDTNAVLLRREVSVGSTTYLIQWFDAQSGAAVAAPPVNVLTQDCDVSTDFELACANIGGVQVEVEVRRTFRDGVLLSTVYTRLDTNAVIAAPTIVPCQQVPGTFTALRCGATSNVTTTAAVSGTRVVLENDVILTKACPTTTTVSNSTVAQPVNGVVAASAAVPVNARSVTVYNVTRARISFTISSHGTVQIPPNGTYTLNLPDNSQPFSGTYTIATTAGNAGPAVFGVAPHTIVDWSTRV